MQSNPGPDSTRRWRTAFIVAAALWIVTALAAAYAIVDQAVTVDGLTSGYNDTREAAEVLAQLGPRVAPQITRAELLNVLREQHPKALIVATDSTVAIGQLTFRFDARGGLRTIELAYNP